MITIKRILFPTDFTQESERAFDQASYLAEAFDAELHVLNVIVSPADTPDDPMDYLELESESSDTWSDAFALAEQSAAKVVHAQVRIETPSKGILRYAEGHEIDLIVMSTHGRKGLDHFLLGSVAEDVVRRAPCPVLTIRDSEAVPKPDSWTNILVPIDFSESSEKNLLYAKEVAQITGGRLVLLHVIEESVFPTIYGIDPVAVAVPHIVEKSEQSLQEMAERIVGETIPFECRIAIGHPVKEIVDFAERSGIQLITIATHGLTGLQRLLIGSVAEKVVRLAPCPVLTIKSYEDAHLTPGAEEAYELGASSEV